jgi:2'-5' RNA ligase/GNAT superfamily N-acetyltransferase
MRARRRLGVALLLDPPASLEVEGLRRALGDSSLGAVAPHLTLVPPVNVRAADLGRALRVARDAAAGQDGPLQVDLGPVATFVPASPVVYLAVGGPGLDRLAALRSAVLSGPLLRPGRWPWVPHVTLADEASPGQAGMASGALGHYALSTSFDRVVVLEERERRWHPLADACFGPPRVVGRGGLALEIGEGRLLGPDVMEMAKNELGGDERGGVARFDDEELDSDGRRDIDGFAAALAGRPGARSIVLTGRREDEVVGVAAAWQSGQVGAPVNVGVLVEAGSRRQGVGRALLGALEVSLRRRGWVLDGARGHGPEAFFRDTNAWVRPVGPSRAGPSVSGPRSRPVVL